jgi:sulfur-oxidizing protein SoxZ
MIGPARIRVPEHAVVGEVIEVRTLLSHAMETGYRIDTNGDRVARNIIERFRCLYDGRTIIDATLGPAVAANPYLAFEFVADRSGELVFEWTEDSGEVRIERAHLVVDSST